MAEFSRILQAVDSHTAGEPTRIVTGGLPHVPGRTMAEKRAFLKDHLDHLRTGLVCEPRGHAAIVLAYLLPPVSDDADFGVVFANEVGYLGMCGHGTMGVASALVTTGVVAVEDEPTRIRFDTPAGQVIAKVHARKGRATAVTVRNVPSFLLHEALNLQVGAQSLCIDVAYGGNWFALVPQGQVDIPLEMENVERLTRCADEVRSALRAAGVRGFDPETGEPQDIDHVEIYASRPVPSGLGARTFTLCPGMSYDRSPCGTGTSAKLAAMHAKGNLATAEEFHNQSITGTEFIGMIVSRSTRDAREVVVSEITGSAHVTALTQFVFDPHDPLCYGLPR